MTEVALRRMGTMLTQSQEPNLVAGNPVAPMIAKMRLDWKGKNPDEIIERVRPGFQTLVQKWKEEAAGDAELWRKMKRTYRVLCLSAVRDHILMWSHYADSHRGAVLEFRPRYGDALRTSCSLLN